MNEVPNDGEIKYMLVDADNKGWLILHGQYNLSVNASYIKALEQEGCQIIYQNSPKETNMEFEWINTEPGTLVLSGTFFSIQLMENRFRVFRDGCPIDNFGTLDMAKLTTEWKAQEREEMGL